MNRSLHVATYNIHKGFSFFRRRMVIHDVREHLRLLNADLVFLQEVQGNHLTHARRFHNWPAQPQYEFLADSVWSDFAYGRNAVYDDGHHGNAILSRFPIVKWDNQDISGHRFESRGLLHCEIAVPGWSEILHCVCVHLALTAGHRSRQLRQLQTRIERLVPRSAPLIIAGDFNDWAQHAQQGFARALDLRETFDTLHGRPARSFPAALPVLQLDRIYVRGFDIHEARVHHGQPWARISDHAALSAQLTRR
jgi:endonuclease/exonuclease/phosphatase family metal-dependent hydrolase